MSWAVNVSFDLLVFNVYTQPATFVFWESIEGPFGEKPRHAILMDLTWYISTEEENKGILGRYNLV